MDRLVTIVRLVSSAQQFKSVDRASVGVLAYVTANGRPNALAVTPYVVDGRLVVTSTLALIDKAASIRVDPRVTLTAGGLTITGTATVQVDPTPAFFDQHIRHQELVKYPPTRSLLAVPFHRKILRWYVGRVVIWIEPDSMEEQQMSDRVTITVLDEHDRLQTWCVPAPGDVMADRLALLDHVTDGAAVALVHEEDPDMRDLRQLAIRGVVTGGTLHVSKRRGTLAPTRTGTFGELKRLRVLACQARANRDRLAGWPLIDPPNGKAS